MNQENAAAEAVESRQSPSESQPPQTSECEASPTSSQPKRNSCLRCGEQLEGERQYLCVACDGKATEAARERTVREKQEAIDRELRRSGLPHDYVTGDRNSADIPAALARINRTWTDLGTKEMPGLFLFGPSKSFKTTLAAAWLADSIRAEKSGRFVDVTDLMTDIQRSYRDDDFDSRGEIVDRLAMTPLLVLDDLGQEKASHHAGEVLRQILDRRRRNWMPGRWLIVTTNRTPEELRDRFEEQQTGNAILHRIAQLTITVPMEAQ